MSEDCLYLNVVTPASTADAELPVFVWFHGKAHSNGYAFGGQSWTASFSALNDTPIVPESGAYNKAQAFLSSYGQGFEKMSLAQLRAIPIETFIDQPDSDRIASRRGFNLGGYVFTQTLRDYFFIPSNLNDLTILYGSNSGESNSKGLSTILNDYRDTFYVNMQNTYGWYLLSGDTIFAHFIAQIPH